MRWMSALENNSCVSERTVPVLLMAALMPAIVSESGASTMPTPSCAPNIQYIVSSRAPTLSTTRRTAVSRSAGLSIIAAMAASEYENSERYLGIAIAPPRSNYRAVEESLPSTALVGQRILERLTADRCGCARPRACRARPRRMMSGQRVSPSIPRGFRSRSGRRREGGCRPTQREDVLVRFGTKWIVSGGVVLALLGAG